ncbi:MAG TPA: zf-HC2 domain-containing protein [Acidobacteriota bacterium]|nr:zf-HC2 domain-containing protein [Acidobacteriota bacterium]
MSCQDFQLLISADLDGALTPSESTALEGHLESCSSCRAVKAQFQEWDRLLLAEAPADQEPPQHLWAAIEAGIREKEAAPAVIPPAQPQPGLWERLAALLQIPQLRLAGAALALVLICGLVVVQMQDPGYEQMLAELDAISGPELKENPYRPEMTADNPYMNQDSRPRNPFSGM